ncbi:MAG: MBL fold metallo-hydrolase [Thaumarchaeota archaeon]|nr:MBL fold metallo-hydrolase [Nitrososphaerota archaeon]
MVTSKVSERVHLIDTEALGQSNTVAVYVVRGTSKTALVDCGYASSTGAVLAGLAHIGVPPEEIDFIIPTHVHLDHGGAAGHLVTKMPRARIFAQERGVPHLVDPTRLVDSATRLFGAEAIRRFGAPLPISAEKITPVGEEAHLDLGGVSLTAIHSPGHAPHQLSVLVEEDRLLLTADAVGIVYPNVGTLIPVTPPPSFNPQELAATTRKLEQMDSKALLVPHYGVRQDVSSVFEATRTKTERWTGRVREMKKASLTLDEMVDSLTTEVLHETGLQADRFPGYASTSIMVTVKGILHYLEKNP